MALIQKYLVITESQKTKPQKLETMLLGIIKKDDDDGNYYACHSFVDIKMFNTYIG